MSDGSRLACALLLSLLTLVVVGCLPSMGEAVLPHPPTAPPPPTAVPLLGALPPPIPHSVTGASRACLLCHEAGAAEAPAVPEDSDHVVEVELCATCHALLPEPAPRSADAPAIPHEVEGREECLMCHKLGIGSAPRIPDNHDGLPVDVCQTCHLPEFGGLPGEGTVVPTVGPPQVPHTLEGRTDCRACHETGVAGAPQFPADHIDRANEVCLDCHTVSSVAETPEVEVAAPQVPHTLEGRTDCRACHETGVAGAPQFPADHIDRANEVCLDCHTVSSLAETPEVEVVAPPVPHTLEGRSNCRICHETGAGGAPQFPADHTGRSNDSCLLCHTGTSAASAPELPHPIYNHSDCVLCHGSGLGGTPLLPVDHAGRTNDVCMDCHSVSPSAASRETVREADLVPHVLSSRADCQECHGLEEGEGPEMPDDHVTLAATTCLVCHGLANTLERIEPDDGD